MLNHDIGGNISISDGYCIVWNQSAAVRNVEISLMHWRMSIIICCMHNTLLHSTRSCIGTYDIYSSEILVKWATHVGNGFL